MRCENRTTIRGSAEAVMAVLAPVERWSLLLPGYPWVRFIGRHQRSTFVQMTARHGPLRLHWTAEHIVYPEEGRIIHRHLRGLTTGLISDCRVVADGEQVQVIITHDWQPEWPLIGQPVARLVLHELVQPIAARTLAALTRLVEGGRADALARLETARRESNGPRRRYGL